MTARLPAPPWIVVMAIGMFACQRVVPPTTELTNVRFAGVGLRGATVIADLTIDNPNDFAIVTDSIAFDLEASDPTRQSGWTPLTHGVRREALRIGAGDRAVVEIPAEFTYAGMGAPIRSILDKGTFDYRIRGEVAIREPRRTIASFSRSGYLSLVR